MPAGDAGDAEPRVAGEALHGGQLSPSRSRAPAAIAAAIGCSEASSTAPASRSTSSGSSPGAAATSARLIRPVVTVPVLSSTIVSMVRVDSSTSGPLITMPSWAPRPVPTSIAVGVARPIAHGQAMISTATAAVNAAPADCPAASHPISVTTATPMTTGTNTAEIRSASRCTGALPACASVTSRAIWASWVSAPTRVARTTSRPPAFTHPPVTASPGPPRPGPARRSASRCPPPSCRRRTTPSVAIFSPGRTTNSSPTASCSTGIRTSAPSRSTATSLAPSDSSARSAAPDAALGAGLEVTAEQDQHGHAGGDLQVDGAGPAAAGPPGEAHPHARPACRAEKQRVQRPQVGGGRPRPRSACPWSPRRGGR